MSTLEENMRNISERIRALREGLGYSYQQLADATGMSKSTLQRYETGGIKNIPISRLNILAKALHTTPSDLMGWKSGDEELLWIVDSYESVLKEAFPNDEFSRLQREGRDSNGFATWTLRTCTSEEVQFLTSFWRLNSVGRQEAKKRISELGKLEEYTSESALISDKVAKEIEDYVQENYKK